MQALAASCEELRARTGNPGTNTIQKNEKFRQPSHVPNRKFLADQQEADFANKEIDSSRFETKTTTMLPADGTASLFYANWQTITLDPRILAIVQGYKIEI
jgi:hypothetical protein